MPSMILTLPTTGAPDAAKTLPLTEKVVGPGGVGLAQALAETIRATSATRRVMRLSFAFTNRRLQRPRLAALPGDYQRQLAVPAGEHRFKERGLGAGLICLYVRGFPPLELSLGPCGNFR